jgi:hypothetical protein
MRTRTLALLALIAFVPVLNAQERAGAKKVLTFAEAVEQAKKAAEAEKLGAAIAALQAAIKDLQKKQRTAILAAMPKPEGWQIQDQSPDEQSADIAAGVLGSSFTRDYSKGEHSMHVEVTANSPMIQMLAMLFSTPALIEADGGEVVKYGMHKAILKKNGDNGQELTILLHDVHLVKVTTQGVGADDLLKVFDQSFVDRLEKPLGK